MTTRQDVIIATIRTSIPAAVGWFLAWLIAQIPTVGDALAAIDATLATAFPEGGVTAAALLSALAVAAVVALYYWLARWLGRRLPWVERLLLGSAKQPVYVDAGTVGAGPSNITTLPTAPGDLTP